MSVPYGSVEDMLAYHLDRVLVIGLLLDCDGPFDELMEWCAMIEACANTLLPTDRSDTTN